MSEDIHVTVPDYQAEWLGENDISPSGILQKAIEDRMIEMGFDPDRWKQVYGG